MDKLELRELTKSELILKDKIKDHLLKEQKYAFVLGPNAIGKSAIILNALEEIKESKGIKFYCFDLSFAYLKNQNFIFYQIFRIL